MIHPFTGDRLTPDEIRREYKRALASEESTLAWLLRHGGPRTRDDYAAMDQASDEHLREVAREGATT
jgi:hypothetical protein